MTRMAKVNYHVHAPERQAYHIDADGVEGAILSPEYAVTDVTLTDERRGTGVNSAPLGFVRPASVADDDWLLLDLVYPDRRGHIMGLAANPNHEWIYQSRMTPDEVAVFNIYDNQGKASVAHSALDMIEDPAITTRRESIESRTLVRY